MGVRSSYKPNVRRVFGVNNFFARAIDDNYFSVSGKRFNCCRTSCQPTHVPKTNPKIKSTKT
jgi:hypothetical protein